MEDYDMIKPLLATLLALAGVSTAIGETRVGPDDPAGNADLVAAEAAKRANDFAFNLYQQQATQPGNVVFSPSSVQIALSMAAVGAAGETATQMNQVLGLSGENPHAAESRLLTALTAAPKGGRPVSPLRISNNLWVSHKFDIKPEYLQNVKQNYRSRAMALDFSDAAGTARTINDSVAKDTNDKIKDLVPPDAITPLTRLILTNAVHFKADWAKKFEVDATYSQPFNVSATEKADVKMMHATVSTKLFEDDQLQAVELPYAYRQFSMWVIAPKAIDGVAGVEQRIGDLPQWIDGAKPKQVAVALPKFKFESQFSLPKALGAMGMTNAFNAGKADFTGISTGEGLFIGDVIHKAMIDVNENGTEAAAATAVVMRATSAMPEADPVTFTADRPFIVALRHNDTGAILFFARVADPRK
jgi:serpin B